MNMHRCVRRRRTARALGMATMLAAITLAITGCGGSDAKSGFNGMTQFKLPDAPTATMPAYGDGLKGKEQALRPQKGKLLLLYFGYTSCPDVCPTTMSALAMAVRSLAPEQQKQLEYGMVTGDPKRDTGKKLVSYLEHFFRDRPVYGFRTTDTRQLEKVEKAFGAASEIDPHKPGEDYTVTHTAFLYAVDRGGNVRVMWPFGALSEDIAADLKVLLEQPEPSAPTPSKS